MKTRRRGTKGRKKLGEGKTRRRGTKGGKKLGQGASAFVIDPPIQCEDGRDMSGFVTRVSIEPNFDEIMSIDRETIINKLKEIDPDQKYFFYPQYCTPGKLSEENEKDGVTEELKKYSEYMKKGEGDWGKYYKTQYRTRTWKEFFKGRKKYIQEPSKEKPVQEQIDYVIKAVELLHKHKILHGDLLPGNILTGPDGLPRIIDFARSIYDPPKIFYKAEMEGLLWRLNNEGFDTSFNP
jgi:serine/threonine protein kinase